MEAIQEIIQLEGRYCRLWDSADSNGWAELYVEDGVFEIQTDDPANGRHVKGRTRLAEMCANFHKDARGLHQIGLPEIEIHDDRAHAWLHFRFRGVSRHNNLRVWDNFGYYDVSYVHDGAVWRIVHRLERPVSRDDHSVYSGFYELPA
jgi:3-phenylpropionate/cinnamic acid dioxygenase small subunit